MKLTFSPIRSDKPLDMARKATALIVNGEIHDFGDIPPLCTVPLEDRGVDWLAADPYRDKRGKLHLRIVLPYAADAAPEQLDPKPITISRDGRVRLPGR